METLAFVLQVLLLVAGLFMIMIILLQRGRGGGLAGAFGGAGGQSAFGTKAGDVFTWITVITATVWVLLAGIGGCAMRSAATSVESSLPDKVPGATSMTGDEELSDDEPEEEKAADDASDSSSLTTPPAETKPPTESDAPAETEPPAKSDATSEKPEDAPEAAPAESSTDSK